MAFNRSIPFMIQRVSQRMERHPVRAALFVTRGSGLIERLDFDIVQLLEPA